MNPSLPFLSLLATAAALAAQAQVAVPTHANDADGHQAVALPFGAPGFRTQILVDAASLAPTQAVITGIRFRADRTSAPLATSVVPNVTVTVSQTNVGLGGLSVTFANNVGANPAVVFQGSVSLPAVGSAFAGPLGWDIAIPFAQPFVATTSQGNLLIDIVGNNAPNGTPTYYLDAMQNGGSATIFGAAGDNPSFDFLNLIVSTGNSLEPRLLTPGHTVEFTSTLSFTHPPGFLLLGLDSLPAPFDLGPLGAPTHSVYVTPLASVPHAWTQSFIGWYTTASVAVPGDVSFVGLRLFGQSVLFEPTANALGILTSAAAEVRIGDATTIFPMQQVDAFDPAAAIGTVVDFGFGLNEYGATPLLCEGVFF